MLSAYYTMRIFQEAGLPDGVINLVYGSGKEIGDAALASPDLAGVHFTGSTAVFQGMWRDIGANVAEYRSYPRIVGETGGKDFIVAHPTADADSVATAILRGSFEYQGQKCSAASRVFAPESMWPELQERLVEQVRTIKVGDVSDFSNFMGAVIDASAFATQKEAIEEAKADAKSEVVVGGGYDDTEGYFVEPTVIRTSDPDFRLLRDELFGPVVTTFVYPDGKWEETLELVDRSAPYALTGAIFADDRQGGLHVESHPLGEPADDQGDLPPPDGLPLPVHDAGRGHGLGPPERRAGRRGRPRRRDRSQPRRARAARARRGPALLLPRGSLRAALPPAAALRAARRAPRRAGPRGWATGRAGASARRRQPR